MRERGSLVWILASSCILVALGGLAVPAFIGRPELSILALYISVPLVAAVVLYLFRHDPSVDYPTIGPNGFRATVAGFLVLQGISFVLLSDTPRPFAYYGIVAVLSTVVFIQIITANSTARSPVILSEIGALLLNISWGVTFKYHYFIGQTDILPHAWYVDRVLTAGYVTEILAEYQFHPLWHILGAIELGVLDLAVEPRYVMFFTSGLAFVAAVGGVYVLTKAVVDDERLALTASLGMALNSFVLFYAMYSISRSIVSVLGIIVLLVVIRSGYRYLALLVFVTFGIVAYHTVSVPFILLLLATLYLLQFLFLERPIIRFYELILVGGIQLVYWAGYATNTFARVQRALARALALSGGGGTTVPLDPLTELANYLSFSLLILLVAYGALRTLSERGYPGLGKVAVLGGLVLAGVSFPGPLQLITFSETFNLARFGQYTYPIIAIAAAAGLVAIAGAQRSRRGDTRTVPIFLGLALLLVLSTSFFAVSNDFVAADNPVVERDSFYTFYLTESEETSFRTLAAVSEGYVFGGQITCKYLNHSPYPEKCHIMEADLTAGQFLANSSSDVYLVRTTELQRRSLTVYDTPTFRPRPSYTGVLDSVGPDHPLWSDHVTHDRIYASEDVVAYGSVDRADAKPED